MGDSLRKTALDVLTRIRRDGTFAAEALGAALTEKAFPERDAALATELVYGVLRQRMYLDYVLNGFSRTPFRKLEPVVRDALRLGAYQILFLDRVPAHAAVNEAVGQVPARAKGFANAVLRKVADLDAAPPVESGDPIERLSIETSHPRWIVERFIERFGQQEARALCEANQQPPPAVLRANTLRMGRDELVAWLKTEGVSAEPARYGADAVVVDRLEAVLRPQRYEKGLYMVQGEASQLAVELLDPKPGEKVLDVCAAPGGKTTHIAARVGPQGRVVATDIARRRLTLVEQNGMLSGAKNIACIVADMTKKPPVRAGGSFDRVLVDAPCSALGELAKNPDARYRKSPEAISTLAKIQRILLERAAGLVRPGGVLVYATCTITGEENEDLIEAFQRQHPEMEPDNAGAVLGDDRAVFIAENGTFLAAPHRTGTGGFFAARFTRKRYA